MTHKIDATDKYGDIHYVNIDKFTDNCPICHQHINPIKLACYLDGQGLDSPYLQLVNRCPNDKCRRIFLSLYGGARQGGHGDHWYFFERAEPFYPVTPSIPDMIKEMSDNFYNIYSQAVIADKFGLTEICGPGYRKALEFLVKDFVKGQIEDDEERESINKLPLSACINGYIEGKAKEVAERTAWIGNDETHYYRIWDEKDVDDLRNLLHLTINFIDSDLVASQYINDMPKK